MKLGTRWLSEIDRSDDIASWVPVVAEIARGSRIKYALDKASGRLELRRALADGLVYPTSYGFVVGSVGADEMEVDMMILAAEPLVPLSIVKVRTVGGCIVTSDDKPPEDKLIGAAVGDPSVAGLVDLDDVAQDLRDRIAGFYGEFKRDQGVATALTGWFGRDEAVRRLARSLRGGPRRKDA